MRKQDIFSKVIFFIVVLLLISPAVKPLFNPGFFSMHDDEQIARLYELDQAVKSGHLPPRWSANLGFGFGYPLFNFYPPLVYYLGEIFHLAGLSFIASTKTVMFLGFFGAFLFMYLWVKEALPGDRIGRELGGIFAGLLYTYAPYHSVDLHVRGALSEFFSFVFLPAVFWVLSKLSADRSGAGEVIVAGTMLAFLVLTHNLIALAFLPILLLVILYYLIVSKSRKKLILKFFMAGAVALGLSAYFWLPALAEKKHTLVDKILIRELADYKLHFVEPSQLWNSPWGYAGSAAGTSDGMSFQAGKIQLIVSFLALPALYFTNRQKKKSGNIIRYSSLIFGFLLFSLFMTMEMSRPFWDIFTSLWYLQFPWRYLMFAALFSGFLGGVLLYRITALFNNKAGLIIFLLLTFVLISKSVLIFQPQAHLNYQDDKYLSPEDLSWRVSGLSFEYIPKEVSTKLSALKTTVPDITKNDIPGQSFVVISGNIAVEELNNTPTVKKYGITGSEGRILINTFVFPGWKGYLDKQEIPIEPYSRLHLISVVVPSGSHQLTIRFSDTPVRGIANLISLITLFAVVITLIKISLKRMKLFFRGHAG